MVVAAAERPLRLAITDLSAQRLDSDRSRAMRLREDLRRWAVDGVHIVQLREKRMEAGELYALAKMARGETEAIQLQCRDRKRMLLLVNGRADVAAAAAADGVHLSSQPGQLTPAQLRTIFAAAGHATCLVSMSCHNLGEVSQARDSHADLVLFGPVFEKREAGRIILPGSGLPLLQAACQVAGPMPVVALGGITRQTTATCLGAGASGVAGIRLFAS